MSTITTGSGRNFPVSAKSCSERAKLSPDDLPKFVDNSSLKEKESKEFLVYARLRLSVSNEVSEKLLIKVKSVTTLSLNAMESDVDLIVLKV